MFALRSLVLSGACLGLFSEALAAQGGVVGRPGQSLTQVNRGWYTGAGLHSGLTNPNYITGECPDCNNGGVPFFRDYFVFDLSEFSKNIVSATLCLEMPSNGYSSPDPSETYQLNDFVGDITALSNGVGGVPAFDDLGTGEVYGSRSISAADNGTLVMIDLNEAAVADMNAALGGLFALGGNLTTLNATSEREFVFGFTTSTNVTKLLVQTAGTECFLVVGDGAGTSSISLLDHTWVTEVGTPKDLFVVSADELVEFVIPRRGGFTNLSPVPSAGPSQATYSPYSGPGWLNAGSFSVQVLMWNPDLFPNRPIQWSNSLAVSFDAFGQVTSVPFGTTSGMGVWMETGVNELGQQTIRFPFTLPGPRQFERMTNIRPGQPASR